MSEVLVIAPTTFELQKLTSSVRMDHREDQLIFDVCGFGPIASAIGTMRLLERHHPRHVILVGIAGAIGRVLTIGMAAEFSRVAGYGIGAGSGSMFRTVDELGWSNWHAVDEQPFGDTIELDDQGGPTLLSVCAASASEDDVMNHQRRFPEAIAEDMESYSVAMACRVAGIPLRVIRGISNVAGCRDQTQWQVDAAIDAVAQRLFPELRQ